jgi:hypothetical protein
MPVAKSARFRIRPDIRRLLSGTNPGQTVAAGLQGDEAYVLGAWDALM